MTVLIYLDSAWVDISNNIDYSVPPTITTRIDDAFASGTIKAWLSRKTNIPPYTPMLIDSVEYYCSSVATNNIVNSTITVHDISVIESTAILKCFLIGTKVYSQESHTWSADLDKFKSLLVQANRMYSDWTLSADSSSVTSANITTSRTYTFGATATLYDCLNEICIANDLKLFVEFSTSDVSKLNIVVNTINATAYTPSSIMYTSREQSSEDYGAYLETYASNVVDRDTVTQTDYLDLKSEDIGLCVDNAVLFTPTPIESIKEFGVHQTRPIRIFIEGLENYFSSANLNSFVGYTYAQLMAIGKNFGGVTVYLFEEFYNDYIAQYFPYVTKFYFGSEAYASNYVDGAFVITCPYACNGKFPIRIYEKAEWELLTPQEQATKPFYTIGSNKIENLNAYYKNDLWNTIIGQSRGNFLSDSANDVTEQTTISDLTFYMVSEIHNVTDIFQYLYWVDYNAMTNPYIRDTKTISARNESSFKSLTRTYGVSANYIDFNKLVYSMSTINKTLGDVEAVVQEDVTNVNTLPAAGNYYTWDSLYWYVSTVTIEYRQNQTIANVGLVRNYEKKAEAIGVDSQSESTNNPLKGIVTRPIYIEKTTNVALSNYTSDPMFIRFTFYPSGSNNPIKTTDSDGTTVSSLIMRCSVQLFGAVALFYTEALDQMVLDYGRGSYSTLTAYTQTPFPYTDSYAECGSVKVELGTMTQTAQGLNFFLPRGYGGTYASLLNFGTIQIDKDARERLTFSLLLKYVEA